MNSRKGLVSRWAWAVGGMMMLSLGAGWAEAADRVVLCEDFMATW